MKRTKNIMEEQQTVHSHYDSPVGKITIIADDKYLMRISFNDFSGFYKENINVIINKTMYQLEEYFSGIRKLFELPVDISAYSQYQKSVWSKLCDIPYGETRSYKQIAILINNPKSSRAVGNACGQNPYPILIPCHRVISTDGSIGGFSDDIEIKRQLLMLER